MRDRVEAALGRWGLWVHLRAWRMIAAVGLVTLAAGSQLPRLTLDASTEGYFHRNDPERVRYEAFREAYGRDTLVLIALRPRGRVFEPGFLATLRALHREIEDGVPLVVDVTSLLNARETRGEEDTLVVGELLEDWPESPEAIAAVEARARANPLYANNLLSTDGRTTTIVIETEAFVTPEGFDALAGFDDDAPGGGESDALIPITGEDDFRIAEAVHTIVERYRSDELEIHVAGVPMMVTHLATSMQRDMAFFTALSVAIIALLLALLFRRVAAVVLPLVTVVASLLATLSAAAMVGIPIMPPSQILPSFLLSVGVGGSVHLLAIYYQARRRGEGEPEAIAHALSHSGLAIVMTALTTAGGLLSFIPAELRPLSHLGFLAPLGVMIALLYTLTLLPALIAVFPMQAPREPSSGRALSQRLLVRAGALAVRRAGLVLAAWALVLAGSAVGIARIELGHDPLAWFPEEDPLRRAMEVTNDELGGSTNFELIVSTGRENGFHDPGLLQRVADLQRYAEGFEAFGLHAGKTLALPDVLKETHRALNGNREAYYRVPDDRRLIAQELLLFENAGSDDVEDLVDPQFSSGRISIRLPMVDAAAYQKYLRQLRPRIDGVAAGEARIEVTGMTQLMSSTTAAALTTLIRSYLGAFVVITALMVALIGRFRLGLAAMLPNLAPIAFTLGLLGWAGWVLDMFTLMIGTIAIGLAVDDTIHFMHNFRREHEATGSVEQAVERTMASTGQALLFTSLVLASGFLVYTQAYLLHLFNFGLLTATAIVVAFLADLTLAPALVAKLARTGRAPSQAGGVAEI